MPESTEPSQAFKRIFEHLDLGNPDSAAKAFMETVFENQIGELETEFRAIRHVVLDNMNSVPLRFSKEDEPDVETTCEDLAAL